MNRNGDLFWRLVEPEHIRIRAYCRKLMMNREDGDDLYQDSLVRALMSFDHLREIKAFRSWLYRIVINMYKNRARRFGREKLTPLTSDMVSGLKGEDPGPVLAAKRRLEIAFAVLAPGDRALITLRELQGWQIDELAVLSGKSEGNIRVRLSRARGKMRRALIKYFKRSGSLQYEGTKRKKEKTCVAQKFVGD